MNQPHMNSNHRRVAAALGGQLDPTYLNAEESAVFNAEICSAIEENLATTNYGDELAGRGITTVALDADGQTVERRSDGTTTVLPAQP